MQNPNGFVIYDHLAHKPLSALGWHVDDIPWTRPGVRWDDYDLVVVRSTWDYQNDAARFLNVLEQIDRSQARLENCLDVVRWNIRKTYLRDLEQRGVAIVPTKWLSGFSRHHLAELCDELNTTQLVLKPVVGANADNVFLLEKDAPLEATESACRTFRDCELMAQPFISSVVSPGEYSLFYFGGAYSHCILKRPKAGDFRVQEEHGATICSASPDRVLLAAGRQVIDAIGTTLLYARVDLVRMPDERFALMELELIEPSLYFPFDCESPNRFADAVGRLV